MILYIGQTTVDIGQGWTTTTWRDGHQLVALHDTQPGQQDTADRLGYRSVQDMNRDHDLAHTMLAHWLGLPWSPTLHDIATGSVTNIFEHYIEEQAVMSLQTLANVRGVSLVGLAERMSKG